MEHMTGQILKAKEVKVEGSFRLDLGRTVAKTGEIPHSPSALPQVLIVENNADFAVLEITCHCGAKNRIRCEYAN